MVCGPAYWATEEIARKKFWLYLASCQKHGVTPDMLRFYGLGTTQYIGGAGMRIYGLVDFLKANTEGFTHVLFSHLWDCLFTAPIDEIAAKYEAFGRPPMLMGAATGDIFDIGGAELDRYEPLFDRRTFYPYPGWSMYIAEIPYVIDRFGRMEKGHHNDTYPIFNALESGLLDPVYDRRCQIFQTITNASQELLVSEYGHAFNLSTGTSPGLVHFLIADADQETGKDAAIIPWAKQLGIIE